MTEYGIDFFEYFAQAQLEVLKDKQSRIVELKQFSIKPATRIDRITKSGTGF